MSRVMACLFVAGLALLAVGMITTTSSVGVALVLVGFLLLAGLAVVAYAKVLRTHGATWDVNPGAARREVGMISVRSGGASEPQEVAYIRSMVSIAVWVAVAALAPVTLSRFGVAGHDLWLACSALALVLLLVVWAVNYRTPEMRQEYAWARLMREGAVNALLLVSLVVTLILVALGLVPDQEPALYLTAVELGLLGTALTLLFLVFSQRRPHTASDPAALPATGGSSA